MKKQIMALVACCLITQHVSVCAMVPPKNQQSFIIHDLLQSKDDEALKKNLHNNRTFILKYRDEHENTLLHLAVLVQNIPLIKAILANEIIGSPKADDHRMRLKACLDDGFMPKNLPLSWAHNDDNKTAVELAGKTGNNTIIRLFDH